MLQPRWSFTRDDHEFIHYLPVDEAAMQWGIYLTGVGRWRTSPGEPYPPPGHPKLYDFKWDRGRTLPEFQLGLVTDGSGEFEFQQSGVQRYEGSGIFFLTPGFWHRYHPKPEAGWRERWILFNGELAHRLVRFGLIPAVGAFTQIGACDEFTDRFDCLLERIHRDPVQNSIVASFHALSLIGDAVELAERLPQRTPSPASADPTIDDPLVMATLEFIWTRSHSVITVPYIAKQLNVNRRTLDRRFVAAMGHSVLSEINSCRMVRAKRLLDNTDLAIKTVANLAGFSSHEQLRVTFQASEGKSPKEYRDSQ